MSRQKISRSPELDDELEELQDDAVIGVALRWSLAAMAAVAVVGGALVWALRKPPETPPVHRRHRRVRR